MTRLAPCSKDLTNFFNEGAAPSGSSHATRFFLDAKNGQSRWVLKEFGSDKGELAQIEAGMAALYFLLGKAGTIPKVYAVYRSAQGDTPSQIFASVSAVFPDFKNLHTFLYGEQNNEEFTDEKMHFLINNGFADVCALSYFFEEDDLHKGNIGIADGKVARVDFDMSAYSIVARPELRGSRSSFVDGRQLTESFRLTSWDIDHFPELRDAIPYYFPTIYRRIASRNGYATQEIEKFISLKNSMRFVNQFYLKLLKIIIIPDEMFTHILSMHIGDQGRVAEISTHFVSKKNELRQILLRKEECLKFNGFLERLSCEDVHSIFLEMKNHNIKNKHQFQQINLERAKDRFLQFIFDAMKTELQNGLFSFFEVIGQMVNTLSPEQLVLLESKRGRLLTHYEEIAQVSLLTKTDIVSLIDTIKDGLCEITRWFDDAAQNVHAIDHLLRQQLKHLEALCHATELSTISVNDALGGFDLVDMPVEFVSQPILNVKKLAQDTIEWIQQSDKKIIFVDLLQNFLLDLERQRTTLSAKISAAISCVANGASFFRGQTQSTVPSLIAQITKIIGKFQDNFSINRVIFDVLSLTGVEIESVKHKIIFDLISLFIQEFSAKSAMDQMRIDPVLFGYLHANRLCDYPSDTAAECIDAFKDAFRPYFIEFMPQVAGGGAAAAVGAAP